MRVLRSFNATHDGDLMRDLGGKIMTGNIGLPFAEGTRMGVGELVGMQSAAAAVLIERGFAEVVTP